MNLNQREAYLKKKGEQARLIRTLYVPPPKGTRKNALALKELSMSYHAKPRKEAEQEITNRIHLISKEGKTSERYSPDTDPYKGEFAPRKIYEEGHDW